MTELKNDLGVEQAYCPLCAKVHEMKKQKRIVLSSVGSMPVRYTEVFNSCPATNYEQTISKDLECLD